MTRARHARRGLFENLPYKVLSLLIALAMWFTVRDERMSSSVAFTLEVQTLPEVAVSDDEIPELRVSVFGTRAALTRLGHQTLHHTVHVRRKEPGLVMIRIDPADLTLPPGVDATSVTPSSLQVRIEPRSARRVPVHVRLVEEEPGTRVRRVTVVPDRVRISGPASLIAATESVWTEAVPVPAAGSPASSGTYSIALPHRQLRVEEGASVSVTVELEEPSSATRTEVAPPSSDGPRIQ